MTRLLTLTGTGGVGKTRLALRVGAEVIQDYVDGVWAVNLAPQVDAALVPKAVASALNVHEQPGRAVLDTLADALRPRDMVLILDNCEHLIQSCADLVETLLRACPKLRVLATSRQALRIAGETVWWVPSLQVPDSESPDATDDTAGAESVRLFVERARAVLPAFVVTRANATAVAQICRRLDGVPLALELAAARLSTLGVEHIVARLDDRFDLLTGGSRTALPRQQTLRGTLEWSHGLLSNRERILLRRLAVFAGGWTLEAAEAVCASAGLSVGEVLDLLAELVSQSLVIAEHRADQVRYRMLETVRQYAFDLLRAAGEAEQLCRSHRDWCLALAEEAEPQLYLADQVRWLEYLEREHDNLRSALAWSQTQPDGSLQLARLATALWRFWYLRGHLEDGRHWLDQALSATDHSHAGALLGAGWLAYGHGTLDRAIDLLERSRARARESNDWRTAVQASVALSFTLRDRGERQRSNRCSALLEESLALSREIGFRWGEAFSLYLLADEAIWRGDHGLSAERCDRALLLFRESGERLGLAYTLNELARLARYQGDDRRATELDQEALVLSREVGNRRGICFSLDGLATAARRRGQYAYATELLDQALVLWRELGNRVRPAFTIAGLAVLAAKQHESERAALLFGAAEAALEAAGTPLAMLYSTDPEYAHAVHEARQKLGEAAFARARGAGQALTLDQAIEEALSSARTSSQTPHQSHGGLTTGLSAREREVAALIAQGRSNREIAEALVISARTADTHVDHILTKLGMHTRAQIAAWVVQQAPQSVAGGYASENT